MLLNLYFKVRPSISSYEGKFNHKCDYDGYEKTVLFYIVLNSSQNTHR